MERVKIGKFFVWTKTGHRPYRSHETFASALKEAKRLAALNPGIRFIVQEFHEKVFVDTDGGPTPSTLMENVMQKPIWYGIKGSGQNAKVRLFAQDPSSNQNVTGVGQCILTTDNGDLDVLFPEDGGSLFSETAHQTQTQAGSSSAQTA